MSSSDEDLPSFSDDELPSFLDSSQHNFQSTNEQSIEELYEKNCRLSRQLLLEKIVRQDVDEDLPGPNVNDIGTEPDSVSIDGDNEEKDKESTINIFTKPSCVQYFNLKDITLRNCGYESVTEPSYMEQALLALEFDEIYHVMYLVRDCGEIQNVNPFVHFILKSMCLHANGTFVVASRDLLTDLLTKLDLEEIKFSSGDIFQMLFNCSADVMRSEIFKMLPPHGWIAPDPSIPKEPIPKCWLLNLNCVLSCLCEILKGCTISEEDLCHVVLYFLIMSTDVTSLVYSKLHKCLVSALRRFSPDSWQIYRSNIATTMATFSETIPLNRQWFYIYRMVKSIPLTSNGAELRKYISVLVLLNLADDTDTLKHSLEYSDELFSLSKLMIILSSLCIDHKNFQHVIIKFFDILVNHLNFTSEEYEQLCKLLKMTEKNFQMSSNLLHLKIIQTRISLSKLTQRKLKTSEDNSALLQVSNPGENNDCISSQQYIDMEVSNTLQDIPQEKTDLQAQYQLKPAIVRLANLRILADYSSQPQDSNPGENDDCMSNQQNIDIEDRNTLHDIPQKKMDLQTSDQQFSTSLKTMTDDSARLQVSNTNQSAKGMLAQCDFNIEKRNTLHDITQGENPERSKRLKQLFNIAGNLRKLALGLCTSIKIEVKVDISDVPRLKTKYEKLKPKIEAIEKDLNRIINVGESMIKLEPCARDQIKECLDRLLAVRQELHTTWTNKKLHFDQACSFLRMAEELDNISSQQKIDLSSSVVGKTFEEARDYFVTHCDFERLFTTQNNKLIELQNCAEKLLLQNHFNNEDIRKRLLEVTNRWKARQEALNQYRQKVSNTLDVYSFYRAVDDTNVKIKETLLALPVDEEIKDQESVESCQRKLDTTKIDISAIETKLKELDAEAQKLVQKNSEVDPQTRTKLSEVHENFKKLNNLCLSRGQLISSAHVLHKFLLDAKCLEICASDVTAQMTSAVVSINSKVQSILELYQTQKPGVNGRQDTIKSLTEFGYQLLQQKQATNEVIKKNLHQFKKFIDEGETIIKLGHYAQDKIRERLDQLLAVLVVLHTSWTNRNLHLDQLSVLQQFLKVAEELDSISSQQEIDLSSSAMDNTVEEVQHQLALHDDFKKLLSTQKNKLIELRSYEDKLLQEKLFDCKAIRNILLEVTNGRSRVEHLSNLKKQELEDNYLYAHFMKEVSEVKLWIEEQKKYINAELDMSRVASIEDKKRKQQIYQGFQAKLTAKKSYIQNIEKAGEELILKNHKKSNEIIPHTAVLSNKFKRLMALSKTILTFNNQTEKMETWIGNTEAVVQEGDTGKDFEHCQALQRILHNVNSEMSVEDARIQWINSLARKLKNQGMQFVQEKQEELNIKFEVLRGELNLLCQKVDNTLEIFPFIRDVDATNNKINENLLALSENEETKDLESVESRQRELEITKNGIPAIETKLQELDVEAQRLVQRNSEVDSQTRTRLSEVHENFKKLTNLCLSRGQSLSSAYDFQKFLLEYKDIELWLKDITARVTSELSTNKSDVQNMLQLLQEQKAEINDKQEFIKSLKESGYRILQQKHVSKEIIEIKLQQLEECAKNLAQALEERERCLTVHSDPHLSIQQYICSDGVEPKNNNYYDSNYIHNDHSYSNSPIPSPPVVNTCQIESSTSNLQFHADSVNTKKSIEIGNALVESFSKPVELVDFSFEGMVSVESDTNCFFESIVEIEDDEEHFTELSAPSKPETPTQNSLLQPAENSRNPFIVFCKQKTTDCGAPNVIKVQPSKQCIEIKEISEIEAYSIPEINASIPEINASIPEFNASIPEINVSIPEINASIPEISASITEINAFIPEINSSIPETSAKENSAISLGINEAPELEQDFSPQQSLLPETELSNQTSIQQPILNQPSFPNVFQTLVQVLESNNPIYSTGICSHIPSLETSNEKIVADSPPSPSLIQSQAETTNLQEADIHSPLPEPLSSPMPEPLSSPMPEPLSSPMPEPLPLSSPMPEPLSSPMPEPLSSPMPEPLSSPMPEPLSSPMPEPLPLSSPMPEPLSSPMPEPLPLSSPMPEPLSSPMPEPLSSPMPDIILSHNTPETLPTTSKRQLQTSEKEVGPEKRQKLETIRFCTLTKISDAVSTSGAVSGPSTSGEQSNQPSKKMIHRYIKKKDKSKTSYIPKKIIPVLKIDSDSDDECQILSVVNEKKKPEIIFLD